MARYDDILTEINDFGRYQKLRYVLICIAGLLPPIATYMHSFIAAIPNHWCNNNPSSNFTSISNLANSTLSKSKCSYQFENATLKCNSWTFDRTYYKSTLTEQWGLVCERSHYSALVQGIYFGGYIVGSVVLGNLSDKFGRRPIMLWSFTIILLGTIGVAFGPQKSFGFKASFIIYTISRFFIACGTRGINETGYILALELVGSKKRSRAAIVFEHFFSLGQLVLVGIAFAVQDWRILAFIIMFFTMPFLSYFWFLPESPRWLLSKNRPDKAFKILTKVAKANKTTLNEQVWTEFVTENAQVKEKNETLLSLVKSLRKYPSQIVLILTMFINWLGNNFIFYGVGLKSNNLGLNPYLTFAISALVELFGYSTAFLVVDKLGRKKPYFAFLLFAGISCLSILFTNVTIAMVVLAMVGKYCVSTSYAILRLYSNEMFPTSVRNTCLGLCSMVGRIAVIFAPFIISVGDQFWNKLPFLVFGVMGIVSALTTLILPETLNRRLPSNLEEAHKLNKIGCCRDMRTLRKPPAKDVELTKLTHA